MDYPQDSIEFAAWFPDDRACADYLAWLRWGDMEFVCHLCGAIACGWPRRDGLTWDCGACKSKTSVTAGTLFSKTRTPLTVWFRAAWDLTTRLNGQSARNLQRNLGLGSYQTAWAILHRYRRAMSKMSGKPHLYLPAVSRAQAQLKRWLAGTIEGAAASFHLQEYLGEFEFRFNRRRAKAPGLLFYRLMELSVATGPITYGDIAVGGTREREPSPTPPGSLVRRPRSLAQPDAGRPWRLVTR